MSKRVLLAGLRRDRSGAVAVEFGFLGGFMIALLLGVLQIGIAMQGYNAQRGIAADVSRYAVVEYQTGNELTTAQIQAFGRSVAIGSPYNLPAAGLSVRVTTAATQRVTGATEMTFTIRSQVTSILQMLGVPSFFISHSRPIFVVDE